MLKPDEFLEVQFNKDFIELCRKHNVNAGYVLVSDSSTQGSLLTFGGGKDLAAYIEQLFSRAGAVEVPITKFDEKQLN